MRRNWLTILLFVLALAVQAIAPASTHVVGASGAKDAAAKSAVSTAEVELCFTGATDKDSPGKAGQHRDFCPLCQSGGCDGAAPLTGRQATIGNAPVQANTLSWTVADRALPRPDPDYARQARAPPAFS